jgi:hypothetical protein
MMCSVLVEMLFERASNSYWGLGRFLMFITLVLFSNLRVSGSLILKDLLEPCVINKIMRTGGSLRGLK